MRPFLAAALVLTAAFVPVRARAQGLGVQANGVAVLAKRNAALGGAAGSGTATMTGFEFGFHAGWFGLRAQVLDGKFPGQSAVPSTEITSGEARISLGARAFSVEGGYGRRAFTGQLGSQQYAYGLAGARSTLDIGGTGISATLAGALYVNAGSVAGSKVTGAEGETALTWSPRHVPIFVTVGYRYEQFTVGTSAGDRPDEISGVVLSAGLRLPS